MYPALLPLMRTPRLPVVDRTDAPADLNGLVLFAERRNLVSARVPSHFKRSLIVTHQCSVYAVVHDATHNDNDGDHGKSYKGPIHDCQLRVVCGDISHVRHESYADDGHYLVADG